MSEAPPTGEPRRLLWLIDSLTVGGAESLVVPFARSLDRSRWDLSVVCMTTIAGNRIEHQLQAGGIAVTNLQSRNLRDGKAFRRLLRLVRERRFDLMHAHLTYAAIWGSLATRFTGVPSLATLHVAPPRSGAADLVRDHLMRFALRRWSARVVMVSDALRSAVLARGGLEPERTTVVHNGIETAHFVRDPAVSRAAVARRYSIPSRSPIAATVSVLRPGKGVDVLIEAARSIPGAYFLVIGDGPMRETWARQALAAGVDERFRWAGHRNDVAELLAGCDVMVHPSREDAFPTVLLEGMAAGLPVVASDVGGIPEIVVPGVTGELVPAGDPQRLAEAVNALIADQPRRRAMSSAARDRAERHFSTAAWIRRLESVYEEVLG